MAGLVEEKSRHHPRRDTQSADPASAQAPRGTRFAAHPDSAITTTPPLFSSLPDWTTRRSGKFCGDNWTKIGSSLARGQLLTTAIRVNVRNAHPEDASGLNLNPHLLAILNLGMNDTEQSLRNTAAALLYYHAGQKLGDPQKYAAWYAANKDLPLAEVERNAIKMLVANLTVGKRRNRPRTS